MPGADCARLLVKWQRTTAGRLELATDERRAASANALQRLFVALVHTLHIHGSERCFWRRQETWGVKQAALGTGDGSGPPVLRAK